jgi:tRNA/rRNA methyltransferase
VTPPEPLSVEPAAARIRFVLVAPTHPGNIGAAARALKTMGLSSLHVVTPRHADFATQPEAMALATHGLDLLEAAHAHPILASALQGVSLAFAMTGYARLFGAPLVELRAAAAMAAQDLAAGAGDIAFVFGTERSGLTNVEVEQCQRCCAIPADPLHGSLNLAQAVMVTAYECRLALGGAAIDPAVAPYAADPPAAVDRLEGLYAHLERALVAAGFLDDEAPKKLMPRLRRLFARARPSDKEVDILRGICAALETPKHERIGRKRPPVG